MITCKSGRFRKITVVRGKGDRFIFWTKTMPNIRFNSDCLGRCAPSEAG